MALRRSIGGLDLVLNSLRRLAAQECGAAAAQQHAASTLVSLRSLWPAAAHNARSSSAPAAQAPGGGCRHYSAAAATPPAASPAAAAAQQQQGQEESLEEIRARIFGTHIGNGLRSGRKVLRQPLVGQKLLEWYPDDPAAADPLMLSIKAEAAKLKLDRLRRRGKAPPKKGAGKRAGKKK